MRRLLKPFGLAVGLFAIVSSCSTEHPTAPALKGAVSLTSNVTAPAIVISQVYGGGGNSGATLKNDFIELFNPGTTPVAVNGWSVQYTSNTGTTWQVTPISGTIQPGKYLLVQEAAGTGGTVNLPTPDATGTIPMGGTAGKVALVSSTTALSGACPAAIDLVGYGNANCLNPAGTLANTTAAIRRTAGCTYTGNATNDFAVAAPSPRNSGFAANVCSTTPPPAVVASVVVTPSPVTIDDGSQQTFSAVAFDNQSPPQQIADVVFTWTSSASSVATMSGTTATGVGVGLTQIRATAPNGVFGEATLTVQTPPPLPDLVISQVYGGGGNAGATFTNDFVEIFNRGSTPVALSNWSVQYASAAGTGWQVATLSGTIQPNRYYLVQLAAGTTPSASLPPVDATGGINMSGSAGKVILARTTIAFTGGCPVAASIADRLAYGSNSTADGCGSSWGRSENLNNTLSAWRLDGGCIDSGNGAVDFTSATPAPRNSSTSAHSCPTAPSIVINEIMADPASAPGGASWGEWFEVRNVTASPIDLQGWTISSEGQPDHVIAGPVVVPAGGYAVLGRGGDPLQNGGVTLDYNYFVGQEGTIWHDDTDILSLKNPAGSIVDLVRWTNSSAIAKGISRALRDATLDNTNLGGGSWGYSTTSFGDGDFGTPGADNGALNTTPPVIPNRVTFSGRLRSDPALPVGTQDQLFAELHDGPTNAQIESQFTWSSDTPAIASVDSRGVMTSLAAGTAIIRATATVDGTSGTISLPTRIAVAGGASYANHTEFGVPTDGDASDDFLVQRDEFTSSFNKNRNIPNWVSFNIEATHYGAEDRCECFTYDPLLPADFQRYNTADYTGAGTFHGYGIDRGHLARSFDRTSGSLDNAHSFLFTNIIPQASDNNQGPWAALEAYLGDLARFQNRELFVVAGASGSKGTVKNEGKITIPENVWKVAVIMPRNEGLANVVTHDDVEVIAVIMPNVPGIRNVDWNTYRTTVDAIEQLSGYDLLSLLPDQVEIAVESNTKPPVAVMNGPFTLDEGGSVSVSAAGSSDPDGDALTYAWNFGDGATATGLTASHSYAQNGNYTITLTVTDSRQLVTTATATASVANVAPAIGAFSGATLLPGETYSTTGSFSDPGADSWSATVNYGDGGATMPLALAGTSFALSHSYASAGTYSVTVAVYDGSATTTRTATVVVESWAKGVDNLAAMIAGLNLPRGTANSLTAKLDAARRQIENDQNRSPLNVLDAFLNELQALVNSGRLSPAQSLPIVGYARRLGSSMSGTQ